MTLFTFLATFGFLFGIDFLFWTWAIVTVLAFIDLFLPLPIVSKALLFGLSVGLLLALFARSTLNFIGTSWSYLTHPATMAFLITIAILIVGSKAYKKFKKVKKK